LIPFNSVSPSRAAVERAAKEDVMIPTDQEVMDRFPDAVIDRDNVDSYRGRLQRRLLVNRCGACQTWHLPPSSICPRCWSTLVTPTEVQGTGKVVLSTTLFLGPPTDGIDYRDGYVLLAVELDEQAGLRVTGTLKGGVGGSVPFGARVRLCWLDRNGVPTPSFELEGGGAS